MLVLPISDFATLKAAENAATTTSELSSTRKLRSEPPTETAYAL
jgi:hypothetical protein